MSGQSRNLCVHLYFHRFASLDAYCRVSFQRRSQKSIMIPENVMPTWDQTMIFENVQLCEDPRLILANPPDVVVEIYDKDTIVRFRSYIFRNVYFTFPCVGQRRFLGSSHCTCLCARCSRRAAFPEVVSYLLRGATARPNFGRLSSHSDVRQSSGNFLLNVVAFLHGELSLCLDKETTAAQAAAGQ